MTITPDELAQSKRLEAVAAHGPQTLAAFHAHARTFLPKLREAYEAQQQENAQLTRQRDHWIQARRETWEAGELLRAERDRLAGEVASLTKSYTGAMLVMSEQENALDTLKAAAQALVEKLGAKPVSGIYCLCCGHGVLCTPKHAPTCELAAFKSLLEDQ